MYLCADLSESGLALKNFPLALKEPLHAKKVNIKQKCASISCQSHIFETFSILHAIDFWYAPRLPRERLLSFTPGCWKSSNLNTKNVKWKKTPPPSDTPRKNPRIFSCEMLEDFKEFFIHPKYTANRMWHFIQHVHKQVGKASPPLFGISQPYTSDCIALLIPLSQFPTFGILIFFVTHSYPWSFLPAPACQVPPLKLCPLKALSQVVLPPLTTLSWGWTAFWECLCCILRPGVLQSWKQVALINHPIITFAAGHPSVTMGLCSTCPVPKQQ